MWAFVTRRHFEVAGTLCTVPDSRVKAVRMLPAERAFALVTLIDSVPVPR